MSELYEVTLKVKPAVIHPIYWDWEFGFVRVYIFAEDPDAAKQKVETIFQELPYEIIGDELRVASGFVDQGPVDPVMAAHVQEARKLGFSFYLVCCPTGTDEEDFANAPFE